MNDTGALLSALEGARAQAQTRVETFAAVLEGLRDARGDADTDDEHDPEGSTLSWDRATHAASLEAARTSLAEIDAAIARVRAGWDGACAGCGRPIPAERLIARPAADRCVHCAARHPR